MHKADGFDAKNFKNWLFAREEKIKINLKYNSQEPWNQKPKKRNNKFDILRTVQCSKFANLSEMGCWLPKKENLNCAIENHSGPVIGEEEFSQKNPVKSSRIIWIYSQVKFSKPSREDNLQACQKWRNR